MMSDLQDQAIRQHCKALRLPTVGSQFRRLAETAIREKQSHPGYLEALLAAEMEERESRAIARLLHEARLPRMKTLEGFEFDRSGVSAAATARAGRGRLHHQGGAGAADRRGRHREDPSGDGAVRGGLPSAAAGAVHHGDRADQRTGRGRACTNQLSRALGRWARLDLICIDELGYVPLAETACELMFQVIADRAEKAAVIVTTNLPFSEWPQVIPNPRLCKALIDRLTDQAHIITTGTDSYRFRRTTAQRKAGKA